MTGSGDRLSRDCCPREGCRAPLGSASNHVDPGRSQRQEVAGCDQGLGRGKGVSVQWGRVSVWEDENTLEMDGGDGV